MSETQSVPSSTAARRQIALYFSLLLLTSGLGDPGSGLAALPIQYFLKDRLHLNSEQAAIFKALVWIPMYIGFTWGFVRDRWQPFGLRDRGLFFLFAPAAILCYLWLGLGDFSYSRLLLALLLATLCYQLLGAGISGVMTVVAQHEAMTGRLSALQGVVGIAPGLIAGPVGGWMAHHATEQATFFVIAMCTFGIFLQGFWNAPAIFTKDVTSIAKQSTNLGEVMRLLRHRPIWPVAVIQFFWLFAPGWGTPLFYYLTDTVKLSPEVLGMRRFVATITGVLAMAGYGFLCQRVPLKKLLWWGTILGTVSGPLYLLIHNAWQAIALAVIVGLLVALANMSFNDLLLRACPKDLEGAGNMLAGSATALAWASGDIFGAWLYQRGGFGLALAATTIVSAMILPVLLLVPRNLIATRDGEALSVTEEGCTATAN